MEVQFQKNAVKQGDPGFQYDKRVDFKYNPNQALSDSWDDSDDSADQGVEVVASSQIKSKPKGLGLPAVGDNPHADVGQRVQNAHRRGTGKR